MPEIGIIAQGAMGAAVARRLTENGCRVITLLDGRSEASRRRAEAAGMEGASEEQFAGAEIVLSIVPPGAATALAESLAPVFARNARQPVFADCNAVDVRTVQRIAAILSPSGARFADGGIIGSPPKPGEVGPTFYFSGEAATDLQVLGNCGLKVRVVDGPVGAASALKMSYAGINKGLVALAAAMTLAASRAGAAAALYDELAASQPQLLQRFGKTLPDMYPKAYRWVAEMREIAAFAGDDPAASRVYDAFADIFDRLATDYSGDQTEISAIQAFLSQSQAKEPLG